MLTPLVLRYKGGKYESVHSSSCINIQECVNLEGAYNCVCRQGYEKQIPKGIDDPEIILGSDLGIESKINNGLLWKYLQDHTVINNFILHGYVVYDIDRLRRGLKQRQHLVVSPVALPGH